MRIGCIATETSDIWSFGLSMMELATGIFPYPKDAIATCFDIMPFIMEEPSPTLPPTFTLEFQTFLSQCLIKSPEIRPNAISLMVLEI
jgi:serine/threonine protein kinase